MIKITRVVTYLFATGSIIPSRHELYKWVVFESFSFEN
jgi:hypothetical protein